jgi:anti-sigma B factor antagonist
VADFPTKATDSGVVIVRPKGRLNMTVAAQLREQLLGLVQSGNSRLVVDLSAVDAIDSSGLGALISGLKAARQSSGDLRISGPCAQVTAVLELTNLNRALILVESPEDAFR